MESTETPQHHRGGIYNYFQGATINNLYVNSRVVRHGNETIQNQNIMNEFNLTNNSNHNVRLVAEKDAICIKHIPPDGRYDSIVVSFVDDKNAPAPLGHLMSKHCSKESCADYKIIVIHCFLLHLCSEIIRLNKKTSLTIITNQRSHFIFNCSLISLPGTCQAVRSHPSYQGSSYVQPC